MLNFCDFIQDYVFSTNHHLNLDWVEHKACRLSQNIYSIRSIILFCFHLKETSRAASAITV